MFVFYELDGFTRRYMRQEYMRDRDQNILYASRTMTPEGLAVFPEMLLDALNAGTVESFAAKLNVSSYWGPQARPNSHESLAAEQFNQYYMRGLLSKLIEEGVGEAEVYRADEMGRQSRRGAQPGDCVACAEALADLRDPQRQLIRGNTGLVRGAKTGISLRRVGQKKPV